MAFANAPQLQIFAFVQFIYGICSLVNIPWPFSTCALLTGQSSCSPNEILLLSMVGLFLTFIGISFFILTVIAYDDAPKKKRLTFLAMYCVSAQIAGAVLAGSDHLGGIMPKGIHIAELSVQLVLFLILATAIWSDSSVTGHNHPVHGGLGVNPKTFNALMALLLISWIFINSDVQEYSDVLVDHKNITDVTKFWWSAWSVYAFELFLLYGFGVAYGTDEDNNVLTVLAIILCACSTIQMHLFRGVVPDGIIQTNLIQTCVVAGIGVIVLFVHRKKRHHDYQSLGELVR